MPELRTADDTLLPTVDPSVLDSYRVLQEEGEPDLVTEFIDTFLDDLPTRLRGIEEAFQAGDAARLRSAAHALKGSAGTVGAVALAKHCGEIEAAGRAGALGEAAARVPQLVWLADRLIEALGAMRAP